MFALACGSIGRFNQIEKHVYRIDGSDSKVLNLRRGEKQVFVS
jgi:hypothetical protein